MTLSASATVETSAWDETVKALGGSAFHTTAWAEYRSRAGSADPVFLRWSDAASEPFAVGLAFLRPAASSRASRLGRWVEIDSPPARRDARAVDFVGDLRAWALSQRGVVEARLGSFDDRWGWGEAPIPHPQPRYEFLLEGLEGDDLFRGMKRGARSSLKASRRDGVAARRGDVSHTARFAELFSDTMQRLHDRKGVPLGSVSPAAIDLLLESGLGRLYIAEYRGEVLAGCVFTTFEHTAYYLLNASNDKALRTGAVRVTLAEALQDLRAAGFDRLNLGGVDRDAEDPASSNHGLFAFKQGFGATPIECTGGCVRLRPRRAAILNLARAIRERARRA